VIFSNKPCTGTPDSLQGSSPLQSPVTTLSGPAPGRVFSPEDKELLAAIQKDHPALSARCAGGDQAVCDLLDCVLKTDRSACARAEGRMSGAGWREVYRREHKARPSEGKSGTFTGRQVEFIIECLPGYGRHSVFWRGEGEIYLKGAGGGGGTGKPAVKYPSVEDAAQAACAQEKP